MVKNCDDMLSRFRLIPERNGQTDGQICYINIEINHINDGAEQYVLLHTHTIRPTTL